MERRYEEDHFSFWPGEKPSKMPAQRVKELFDQALADPNPAGLLSLTMALLTEEEWQEYAESLLRETPPK